LKEDNCWLARLVGQNAMPDLDAHDLARLIAALPPAPQGWVTAAQQLPAARAAIETLAARAQADATQRQMILADLDAALEKQGVEPRRSVIRELQARLERPSE
jgi:hypothetical protein